ncbi:MAG TPA: energy transducer TonB [Rubrobacter sp.]|nr:energy transducer TonB [Rubrobacter sp.]
MRSRSFAPFMILIALGVSPGLAQDAPQMTDAQRISLCKDRVEKPLEPSDVEPVRLGPDTRPVPISTPWPQFSGRTKVGSAVIEGIIDEDGCLRVARVLKGDQEKLDRAALKAVRQWVFKPAQVNGKTVRVRYYVTINYTGRS